MFAPLWQRILRLTVAFAILLQIAFWSPAAFAASKTGDRPAPPTPEQASPARADREQAKEADRDRQPARQEQVQGDSRQTQDSQSLHHYNRKAIEKFNEELYGN
jgi:hypothetical protein